MAADTATPSTDSASRRRWLTWVALLSMLAIVALVVLHPDLRALTGDAWREMRSVSPAYLALVVACKVGQAHFAALTWRNALLAAWPHADLSYRFVLGVDQGQDAINLVAPARAGTWAKLGIFGLSIQGAQAPTLLAAWGVQSLAFGLFAAINYTLIAIRLPDRARGRGVADRLSSFASSHPLLAGGIAAIVVFLLVAAAVVGRRKVDQLRRSVRDGLAILATPWRYVRLLFLPSLAAYLFRCASHVALLAAFGIPVTIWTLALALGSHSLADAVSITPGGFGTTQAIDMIALRDVAEPEVVVAYSLSEVAIRFVVSLTIAIVALVSVAGWHGTRALLLHRDASSAGSHPRGDP